MPYRRVRAAVLCGLVSTLAACTAPESADPGQPGGEAEAGAAGIGDPYYPNAGNGGYDATGYVVSVRYNPSNGRLRGDTTVTAEATHDLDRFNLDLRGFTVSSVEVDGEPARFSREDDFELVVTPARPLPTGSTFSTRVRYAGKPQGSADAQLGGDGWQRSPSGGAFVLGEPRSASYWYPVNEHPRDKATFELRASVPKGWSAVSIGRRGEESTKDGWTTTTWKEPDPVASYLTTIVIDRFSFQRGELEDGTPVLNAFAPGSDAMRDEAARVAEIVDFLAGRFGEYPATTAGGIYLGTDIGYSLETQGRPTYTRSADLDTVVHEIAHQWYGNSVSVRSWADICLNECFASYSQWLWAEHKEGDDLDTRYRRAVEQLRDDAAFWAPRLYDMGAGHEFEGVYDKGILAIHALRQRIGDRAFDRVLREWPAKHREGNASWPQFEEYVQRSTGQDLRGFFDAWFRSTKRPPQPYLYPS